MYLQSQLDETSSGLGACAVPASVTLQRLVCTTADRTAIGAALGLGRDATVAEVRTIITDAVRRAVVLIARAAAPLRRPRAGGAAGEAMRLRFRDAFGTAPEFIPTWRPAGQTWDRGAVVRERLRCAAKIMSEGDIEFVCWGPGSCPFEFAWDAGTWAVVLPGQYRICLGARFWRASREGDVDGLATTLLHECLHIYFDTIRHELERGPYNTAACYERYVLLANRLPVPAAVSTPCRSSIPKGDFPLPRAGADRVAGLGWFGQPSSIACKPEPGEVAASRTAAGILTKDVEITDKGVLITDFGVDRGSVKPSAKVELAATLDRLENDPRVKTIKIMGFDDCLKASPKARRILRKRRALKVKELLRPKARAKVTFAGGAPLATFVGPNTDRAARARNRSVLIEFMSEVSFADEPQAVTAQPCHEQLIRRALRQMRDDQSMDGKIKSRLGAALGNSLAGHDDSFIRPGSTSWMFPFHWSSIKQYFKLICDEPGGAATLSATGLMRKLLELDQDIRNGVESLVREEQKFSSMGNKKMVLATDFRRRLDALLKNKANSVYAEY